MSTSSPVPTAAPLLVLSRASKNFGAVQALIDGSVTLYAGEAHALLGENGAGKSTLVKILAGVHRPDGGELLVGGEAVSFSGPAASRAAGISIIYQEPTLFPDLTVAENIFMGRQPLGAGRRIDRGAMNQAAADVFARLGVVLDPDRLARGLSVADQQIVEIAKALSLNAQVLVMDEPTAALTNVEVTYDGGYNREILDKDPDEGFTFRLGNLGYLDSSKTGGGATFGVEAQRALDRFRFAQKLVDAKTLAPTGPMAPPSVPAPPQFRSVLRDATNLRET